MAIKTKESSVEFVVAVGVVVGVVHAVVVAIDL